MGWVTLSARKQSLTLAMSELEMRDLQISRTLRSIQRASSYEQSIINSNKQAELQYIKSIFDEVSERMPADKTGAEYQEWYGEYQIAMQNYEAERLSICNMYDTEYKMLEDETQEKETDLEQEKSVIEAQLEAMQAEFEVIKEQISKEIEDSAIAL